MRCEGAEAIVYDSVFAGMDVLVKQRISKRYRPESLDKRLINGRTRREVKLLHSAKMNGVRCPIVYYVGSNYFLMSKIKGNLLRDVEQTPELAERLGQIAARMHRAGIVHGDFTTANIIVSDDLYVIDFGLGYFSEDIEDKAVDLLLMKRSLQFNADLFLSSYEKAYGLQGSQIVAHIKDIEKRARYVQR